MEGNVVFCKVEREPGAGLAPTPEAVLAHPGVDSIQVAPGSTLGEAVERIKHRAGERFPPGSVFWFLTRKNHWMKIRAQNAQQALEPCRKYYFRVAAPESYRRQKTSCGILEFDRLHSMFPVFKGLLHLDHVPATAFLRFTNKSSALDEQCRAMVSAITRIHTCSDQGQFMKLVGDFEACFGVRLFDHRDEISAGKLELVASNTKESFPAVVLHRDQFVCVVVRHGQLLQSKPFLFGDANDSPLLELGFLSWLGNVMNIRPMSYEPDQIITIATGGKHDLRLRVLHQFSTSSVSNSVFKVMDEARGRLLLMKIGHSMDTKKQITQLCLHSRLWDQLENDARILQRLNEHSDLFPRVVFSGFWNQMPVLLTELDGESFAVTYTTRPLEARVVERLCKDLTESVLVLHSQGIAHADINPSNIGVQHTREGGTRFYLYDFGCAVDLKQQERQETAVNLLYSSWEVLEGRMPGLMSELVSVAYVCLDMAGECLPWEGPALRGEVQACRELRQGLRVDDELASSGIVSPALQAWLTFVVCHPSDEAVGCDFVEVLRMASSLLGLDLDQSSR